MKSLQKGLINGKIICKLEFILLTDAIFLNHNFALFAKYNFNFVKKLGLKVDRLKV